MPAPGNKVRNGGSRWVSKPAGDKAAAAGRAGNGGAGLQTVFLDFETYYDDDYTLRKLSTSEYIRDSRFEAISVGIKIDMGQTEVYFGEDVAKALKRVDWSRTELVCHHTHFDGLILSHHFKIVPARYACTLSMGRALHPKSERNDLATVAQKYGAENKLEMPIFTLCKEQVLTAVICSIQAYSSRRPDIVIPCINRHFGTAPCHAG